MENKTTALLVMDMQMGILSRFSENSELLKTVAEAIRNARKNKILVIFVRLGFQRGLPEISADNAKFSALKAQLLNGDLEKFMEIHPELGKTDSDIVVNKKRISAFSGSDLEMILKSHNVKHLVLTGISTSGIVLSTVREASDKDYRLTVLSDACKDSVEEIHNFLIEKIFSTQAEVLNVKDWIFL